MPGRQPRTNRFLILIAVLLCLLSGAGLTQSSANPSPIQNISSPDMYVADSAADPAFSAKSTVAEPSVNDGSGDASALSDTETTIEDVAAPQADITDSTQKSSSSSDDFTDHDSSAEPAKAASDNASDAASTVDYDVSPEASSGVWTSRGSSWMFLVNGTPYTGWLFDADGKHYFFNPDGIMQTGWVDDNGKRYYLNLDGIMQTGELTIGKKTYHLLDDGSLEGYQPKASETPTPKPTSTPEATPTPEPTTIPDGESKTIALTFDDGPSSFTDRLLTCLEENNAKATFFMVGQEIPNFPDAVKRMEALGCEIGNHTYNHVDLTTLGPDDISSQIGQTDQALLNLIGHGATVVRPPYGSINSDVEAAVGTPMILWSVDTLDWKTLDVLQTVDAVMEGAANGGIILMHDIYETSVQAAEIVIPKLIEEGYQLVTVHELAAAHGVELKTGIAYGSLN